jgi:PAS domain S-box-containing protein
MNGFIGPSESNAVASERPCADPRVPDIDRRNGVARDMFQADDAELSRLRAECRRLEALVDAQAWELNLLRARFARYETALRGSHVTVFTQDRDLRYTSINNPILGRSVEDVLGRTDHEILPAEVRTRIIAMKQEALAGSTPQGTEFAIEEGHGIHWFDLYVEPLRNDADDIIGLAGAAVNMTERKESEAHLRLLLRELTHRSKNLLAVIQAMARQTARHAGSVESFLSQFGARLQALAASHDLLVRESWYGALVDELVRSHLAVYLDRDEEQVSIDGPAVALRPEAAQALGLALHELANNAAKFGALSVPNGRLSISWDRREHGGEQALELEWREQFGPRVKPRRKRGFGSMVIERNLAHALDAEVDLDFDPDGLRCHVVIPASQILAAR